VDSIIVPESRTPSSPINNNPETPILGMSHVNGHTSTRQRQSLSAQRSASPHVAGDGQGGLVKKKKTAKKGWKGWALVVEDEQGNVIEIKDPEPVDPVVVAGSVDLTPLPSRGESKRRYVNNCEAGAEAICFLTEGSVIPDISSRNVDLPVKGVDHSSSPSPTTVILPRECLLQLHPVHNSQIVTIGVEVSRRVHSGSNSETNHPSQSYFANLALYYFVLTII